MSKYIVPVPRCLTLETTIHFVHQLATIPEADEYIFNFHGVGRIEPFALLFLSSELQRCQSMHPQCKFGVMNHTSCTYAAHMGFFQAFGIDYGKLPGQARGSSTYIPITIFDSDSMRQQAAANFEEVGDFIEKTSQNTASVLTRQDSGDLFDTLTYSIREIMRNVIEHSYSNQFGFCAQYWPTYGEVELAILDRGIGVRAGLSSNPNLQINSDHEALNLSLMPGVSGKAHINSKLNRNDVWANSGYGLYMTSRLCREGGNFFILSGEMGLFLSENKRMYFEAPFKGTALKLNLNTKRISSLGSKLERFRVEAYQLHNGNLISASTASQMLSRDFKYAKCETPER